MLGGSSGVAFQQFHSGVTHSNSAAASGALHISQGRQERSLGHDIVSTPY